MDKINIFENKELEAKINDYKYLKVDLMTMKVIKIGCDTSFKELIKMVSEIENYIGQKKE